MKENIAVSKKKRRCNRRKKKYVYNYNYIFLLLGKGIFFLMMFIGCFRLEYFIITKTHTYIAPIVNAIGKYSPLITFVIAFPLYKFLSLYYDRKDNK